MMHNPESPSPEWWANQVLNWYQLNGRHHLPWQNPITPYRCWISEVMLQQTQVNTVIPYFAAFMNRFPTVKHLAEASLDSVLSLWSGLGYYSRARSLHRAAQMIQEVHGGIFPHTAEDWMALPGIGQSTAHAIRAQAYELPAAILDGNVKRVLCRFHGVAEPINQASTHQHLWKLAEHYLPPHSAQAYTQAMMDLGAMVCTRTKPSCSVCPLQSHCVAHHSGIPTQYPSKLKKPPKPRKEASFALLSFKEKIALIKRPPTGIWGGLWCLPDIDLLGESKISSKKSKPMGPYQHTFTHFHLDYWVTHFPLSKQPSHEILTWSSPEEVLTWGLPAPIRKVIENYVTSGG